MAFFTVNISGEETMQTDLDEHLHQISEASDGGLQFLASDMLATLQKHIRQDWYEAWGDPLAYERRTDDESRGVPLGDISNMTTDVHNLTLLFDYSPTGEHTTKGWSSVSGDRLIEIIQKNEGWKYDVKKDTRGRAIMPRPFWNNFVEEEKSGAAFDAFSYGFSGRGYDLIPEGRGDVIFEANEGMLGAGVAYDADL